MQKFGIASVINLVCCGSRNGDDGVLCVQNLSTVEGEGTRRRSPPRRADPTYRPTARYSYRLRMDGRPYTIRRASRVH